MLNLEIETKVLSELTNEKLLQKQSRQNFRDLQTEFTERELQEMVMEDGFATFLSSVEKELSPGLLTAQTTKALKFYRNYCKRK